MTRAIGIDPADDVTRWAVAASSRVLVTGRVRSTVTVDGIDVDHVVDRLGRAEPIVVGGVPYGAEALLGRLLAATVEGARSAHGELVVAVVHDDDLDEYRRSLLVEAARVGEVGPVVLVARSTAVEAAAAHRPDDEDLTAAVGAALWLADQHGGGGIGPGAAIAGGGVVGLAAGAVVATTSGGGPASAAAPAAGPTGTPLTPTTAGPTGTPLTPATAGPTGTPLTPAGPTGTPLTPATAGPTGTPLTPSGPPPAGPPKGHLDVTTGVQVARTGSAIGRRGLGLLLGGGALVAAATVGIVVATGDDEPAVRPAAVAGAGADTDTDTDTDTGTDGAAGTDPAPTAGTEAPVSTTTPTTAPGVVAPTTAAPGIDLDPFLGEWLGPCEPYIDGSGEASRGGWIVTAAAPDRLSLVAFGREYATADCSGPGDEVGLFGAVGFDFELEVIDTTTVDGLIAYVVRDVADGTVGIMAADGGGLRVGGLQGTSVPTSFDGPPWSRE